MPWRKDKNSICWWFRLTLLGGSLTGWWWVTEDHKMYWFNSRLDYEFRHTAFWQHFWLVRQFLTETISLWTLRQIDMFGKFPWKFSQRVGNHQRRFWFVFQVMTYLPSQDYYLNLCWQFWWRWWRDLWKVKEVFHIHFTLWQMFALKKLPLDQLTLLVSWGLFESEQAGIGLVPPPLPCRTTAVCPL